LEVEGRKQKARGRKEANRQVGEGKEGIESYEEEERETDRREKERRGQGAKRRKEENRHVGEGKEGTREL
jgi:hypothetical protein